MIPTSGMIGPLPCKLEQPRGDHRLPCAWVCADGHTGNARARRAFAPPSTGRLALATGEQIDRAFSGGEAIAFLLGAAPQPAIIDALLAMAGAGTRVYVLAGPGFGEGRADPGMRELNHARVLVRRLATVPPCTGILSDRGTRAGIGLAYPPGAEPTWWLSLSPAQGEALFRVFIHLFWHAAVDEAFTGAGALVFRKALPRPFDAQVPGATAPVRLIGPEQFAHAGSSGEIVYMPEDTLPAGAAAGVQMLLTPAHATGQEALAGLARAGVCVAWEDLGLPAFRVGHREGTLALGQGPLRLHVALEPDQALALHKLASAAADGATWKFLMDVSLASLRGQVWLPGQLEAAPLIPSEVREAAAVHAPELSGMATAPRPELPAPSPLALSVTYRWQVLPPRLPRGTKEDPLIDAWRGLDTRVRAQIETLKQRLDETDRHAGTLGRFAAIAGALLGLGRARKEMREVLQTMDAQLPSARGPGGARELLQELERIKERLGAHENDLRREEQRAHEETERQEQLRSFEVQRRQAEEGLATARKNHEVLDGKRVALESEIGTLTAEAGQEDKDKKARIGKLRGERDRLSKDLRKIESEIRSHEEILKENFEYRPARRAHVQPSGSRPAGGALFVPPPSAARADEVPDEALPRVGVLQKLKDTRYLVISRWEELVEGGKEAKRLGARLVAPEDRT